MKGGYNRKEIQLTSSWLPVNQNSLNFDLDGTDNDLAEISWHLSPDPGRHGENNLRVSWSVPRPTKVRIPAIGEMWRENDVLSKIASHGWIYCLEMWQKSLTKVCQVPRWEGSGHRWQFDRVSWQWPLSSSTVGSTWQSRCPGGREDGACRPDDIST